MEVQSVIRVICIIVMISVLNSQQESNEAKWINNFHNSDIFKCRDPQPRAMKLKELMDPKDIPQGLGILPYSAVLHRCDSAGCCHGDYQCLPTASEEVELIFRNEVEVPTRRRVKKAVYFPVKAVNHTKCACQNVQGPIK